MPAYSVVVPHLLAPHDTLAEVDTLEEAVRIANRFAHLKPLIVANGEQPRLIDPSALPPQPASGRLSRDERRAVEIDYLNARAQLAAAGRPQAEIDSLLPLTPDGGVPWGK